MKAVATHRYLSPDPAVHLSYTEHFSILQLTVLVLQITTALIASVLATVGC